MKSKDRFINLGEICLMGKLLKRDWEGCLNKPELQIFFSLAHLQELGPFQLGIFYHSIILRLCLLSPALLIIPQAREAARIHSLLAWSCLGFSDFCLAHAEGENIRKTGTRAFGSWLLAFGLLLPVPQSFKVLLQMHERQLSSAAEAASAPPTSALLFSEEAEILKNKKYQTCIWKKQKKGKKKSTTQQLSCWCLEVEASSSHTSFFCHPSETTHWLLIQLW